MKNCIILGSGRSGTSMATGVLAKSGYFMGGRLNPVNETNPKGQFEDSDVNRINEELLSKVTPVRPSNVLGEWFFRSRPVFGQRWLARVPLNTTIPSTSRIEKQIQALTKHGPFCFKDPRFSYTLPVWKPFIKNMLFICVFRHPGVTVTSILKQAQKAPHLHNFSINAKQAFQVWEQMYSHIIKIHYPLGGDWIFLHYNQFLDGPAFVKLEKRLGVKVDHGFVEPQLNRSKPLDRSRSRALSIYDDLCNLACYNNK